MEKKNCFSAFEVQSNESNCLKLELNKYPFISIRYLTIKEY